FTDDTAFYFTTNPGRACHPERSEAPDVKKVFFGSFASLRMTRWAWGRCAGFNDDTAFYFTANPGRTCHAERSEAPDIKSALRFLRCAQDDTLGLGAVRRI
ncbi:MAG: hypothetical protein KA165_08005, partial [Saprospiraceae bacterium]|nr:hypothetical protein [Saprospiraceae bacterium]